MFPPQSDQTDFRNASSGPELVDKPYEKLIINKTRQLLYYISNAAGLACEPENSLGPQGASFSHSCQHFVRTALPASHLRLAVWLQGGSQYLDWFLQSDATKSGGSRAASAEPWVAIWRHQQQPCVLFPPHHEVDSSHPSHLKSSPRVSVSIMTFSRCVGNSQRFANFSKVKKEKSKNRRWLISGWWWGKAWRRKTPAAYGNNCEWVKCGGKAAAGREPTSCSADCYCRTHERDRPGLTVAPQDGQHQSPPSKPLIWPAYNLITWAGTRRRVSSISYLPQPLTPQSDPVWAAFRFGGADLDPAWIRCRPRSFDYGAVLCPAANERPPFNCKSRFQGEGWSGGIGVGWGGGVEIPLSGSSWRWEVMKLSDTTGGMERRKKKTGWLHSSLEILKKENLFFCY